MTFIDPKAKRINCKIIYFGPALSGKSTTLQSLHKYYAKKKDGKMLSLGHQQDRTTFFDFLPLSLGKIRKHEIRFHLYAIPGPIFHEANRRLLLKGIDGIVFVADSRLSRLEENLTCMQDLEENLRDQDVFLEEIPFVLQYNKRDLKKETVPVDVLNKVLNQDQRPAFETIATRGTNVVEPLETITKVVLQELRYED